MFKKLGVSTLALAAALAVAAPTLTMASERDYRGGRTQVVEHRDAYRDRGRDDHRDVRDRDDFRFRAGFYAAPAPIAAGYYDRFGVWHAYGNYEQFGYWRGR
jgi:hypothetical protein